MSNEALVIGVDFGTDSVRSLLVNARTGEEIASAICEYPRWKAGLYCLPAINQFRQHPLDYIESLEKSVRDCLQQAGPQNAKLVKGISVDTTGSTPAAVDRRGTPLALLPEFAENPQAMFILWKDHTAVEEAAAINAHAKTFDRNYLQYVGGIYSSEWFWAKWLHILRIDDQVRKACHSWVEHCDWIPFLLTGGTDISSMKRGICSAGHKALWSDEFGGLPPQSFFSSLDPLLNGLEGRLFDKTYTANLPAGPLSPEWAIRLGLTTDVIVGTGAFDAHMGAVGGQIEPYHLSKVMGTSTCDMLVAPMNEMKGKLVQGICGQVPGSIIPGMMGMEAGQSAFGDAYAWFRDLLLWPVREVLSRTQGAQKENLELLAAGIQSQLMNYLSEKAAELPPEESSEISIDWLNGRRTPDANQLLKGSLAGLTLGSDAPRIFRAIAEGTCFGARAIVERFVEEKIPVKGLIVLGGVAKKSPFIMQMLADTLNMPIRIHRSEHSCALGAAMFAATAAGIYPRVEEAMQAMGPGFDLTYYPRPERATIYHRRYQYYRDLGKFIEENLTRPINHN